MDLPVIVGLHTNKQELPHTRGGHYMDSIIYVGMDVHTTNYTLCCFSPDKDRVFAVAQVEPDFINILILFPF